ncbi:hypothetical protein ACEWY4_009069 [Coilia grayii]|uniref:Tectonic domain-containing protein n=1 Tax=Coilia grayii TaxID=363190 RepID=A0ABD1K5D5_9TELE
MYAIIFWPVLSLFALCIISTVPLTTNETDLPLYFNNTNFTDEPIIPFSPTDSGVFETASIENLTETSLTFSTTESITTKSTPTGAITTEPIAVQKECSCDITPGFCDIGCCCDNLDCEIDDLSSVFSGWEKETRSPGVCIEKWLMFRANVDPDLITVTDTLFCVREETATEKKSPSAFSGQGQNQVTPSFAQEEDTSVGLTVRDFYKVDDMILLQYNRISMLGTLKQPSPGVASSLCVDLNPARFMRATSHSCSRAVSAQSCWTDHRLNVHSYFEDISLLRVPNLHNVEVSDLLIPVVPMAVWPSPSEQNGTCLYVISKVEYVIEFTHEGEITGATLWANFLNSTVDAQILQQFAVTFKLATPVPTPATLPAMGLIAGTPVIGRFGGEVKPLTTLAPAVTCSVPQAARVPILFTHNSISGCYFRSTSDNCAELRSEVLTVLMDIAVPNMVAMSSGPQPAWAEVITEDCPESQAGDSCVTGCFVPRSLSIQLLWAQRGLLSFPQSYILGAKYQFGCQKVTCPLISSLTVTSEVTFADTTVYPEPPRRTPQPHWKFPYDFFTRGLEELDDGL